MTPQLTLEEKTRLEDMCRKFRRDVVTVLHEKQTGHTGGSLSCCEILTVLYEKVMRYRSQEPGWEGRDRLVLSKGHAAPMLYRVLAEEGFFPKEEMHTLRDLNTRLQGHPSMRETPGVDASSGPLGLGLSVGLGMSLGLQHTNPEAYVFVLLGDGELQEGTVWEAAMSAAKFRADHLIAIVDRNGVQLDGTNEEIMPMGDVAQKFQAFGWRVLCCDGHDVNALCQVFGKAKETDGIPTVIIANTVKGKGVSFMEGKNIWHGKAIDAENYQRAMTELGGAC